MAPDNPDRSRAEVTRTGSSPAAFAATQPSAMAEAVRYESHQEASMVAAPTKPDDPAPELLRKEIDSVVAMALQPDAAEETNREAEETRLTNLGGGILEGLSNPAQFAPAGSERPEQDETPLDLLYVTGTRVNVRAGPSTDYHVVGSVAYGAPVKLVSYQDGWARIRINDGETTGYMSRSFLAPDRTGG